MPKKRRVLKPAGGEEGGGMVEEGAPVEGGKIPRGWQLTRRVKEDHGQALFGLSMNLYDVRRRNLFATTGANRATVYELEQDGGIQLKQVYVDAESNESFFCCAWSIELGSGDSVLAIAGQLGLIRVLNLQHHRVTRTLVGHGNSINDLRFHPYKPALLLSASKDESIRLWDVESCVCVALFTGDGGHRGEVLSVDFHLDGDRFVSAGMDNAAKVWSLKQCQEAIEKAETFDPLEGTKHRKGPKGDQRQKEAGGATRSTGRSKGGDHSSSSSRFDALPPAGLQVCFQQSTRPASSCHRPLEGSNGTMPALWLKVPWLADFLFWAPLPKCLCAPDCSKPQSLSHLLPSATLGTWQVQEFYCSDSRWCGDLLLTKSTHNKVAMWKPSPSKASGQDAALVLGEFRYTNSDIWFLRFNLDSTHSFLSLGNKVGHIFLWDLSKLGTGRETVKLSHSQCTSTIRQTAISWDGRTILAVSDDASVWRWDATR